MHHHLQYPPNIKMVPRPLLKAKVEEAVVVLQAYDNNKEKSERPNSNFTEYRTYGDDFVPKIRANSIWPQRILFSHVEIIKKNSELFEGVLVVYFHI